MRKSMNVIVDGKSYDVEVGDLSVSPVEVVVNGKTYSVQMGSQQGLITAPAVTVTAPIKTLQPEVKQPVRTVTAPTIAGGDVRSPMPGIIHDIAVKPGDKITAKQQICTLEAMKMKSAIRSPRDGVVASVAVTNGEKVAHNQIIINFE